MATWLSVFAALGVYVLTVFGLRPLVIRNAVLLDKDQFEQAHPTHKWLLRLHEVLSFPAFLAGLIGGPVLAMVWCEETQAYTCGAWLSASFWNLFNGLFELITNIHPSYGLLIRRYGSQEFLLSEEVRKLGMVRIALSVSIWIGIWTQIEQMK
ncbi:MAG: hypothetical protein ACP5J4_15685 [Anaerolineae bacterium]